MSIPRRGDFKLREGLLGTRGPSCRRGRVRAVAALPAILEPDIEHVVHEEERRVRMARAERLDQRLVSWLQDAYRFHVALRTTLTIRCVHGRTRDRPPMPDGDRRRLVKMLAEYDVALVEDDVYGDLRFDGQRPVPAQFLGTNARVITCGSFSKTAAPGYRIGWVVTRQYVDEIARLKRAFSCSSGLLQQLTLADFLASGDFSRHLKTLRSVLQCNMERMSALVAEHFPAETRTSRPVGGSVLWLELPRKVNAEQLFDDAINAGISIAPGHIFSPCACYTNFVRLSFGHPWSESTEKAMRWLGQRVEHLAA